MDMKASLLVVDDEQGVRDMMAFALSRRGFNVETAEGGLAAIEALRRRRFDLAITDLKMPGMDGVETLSALHALDPDLGVIILTGYGTIDTAVACLKLGAFDYLQKPFEMEELAALLQKALEERRFRGMAALQEACKIVLAELKSPSFPDIVVGVVQKLLQADDVALLLTEGGVPRIHRRPGSALPSDPLVLELVMRAVEAHSPFRYPAPGLKELFSGWEEAPFVSSLTYPLSGLKAGMGALVACRRHPSPEFSHGEFQKGSIFALQLSLFLGE